ncbi:MFS transporter [Streptacidiphilus sp. EB129]|uniref:MFS transporter n=1 Tax=Streptacidiphilus sp. EB129 TaxID=3156262 RepID=UPI0035144FE6
MTTTSATPDAPTVAEVHARLDRMPQWGISPWAKAVFAAAYFFAFYDIIALGAVLPDLAGSLHLSGAEAALPLTTSLAGYVVGAYVFGSLADRIGRRRALRLALVLLAAASAASAFSWDLSSLSLFRLLAGAGIGAQITLSATLITELSPSAHRARNIQRNVVWAGLGDAAAPFIALGLLHVDAIGWRLVLAVGALAVIPAALIGRVPESPRWLAVHGRAAEAGRVLAEMERRLRGQGRELAPVPARDAEHTAAVPDQAQAGGVALTALLRAPYRKRIIVVTGYWILLYLTVYGFLGEETVLLDRMSLHQPNGLFYTALGDIAFPLGAALPLLLLARVPRTYLLAASSLVFALGLAVMATSSGATGLVTGAFLVALVILVNSGVGYVYTSEVFPTRVRATAMGLADGVGHLGGLAAPYVVLAALGAWGPRGAFWLLAALMVACAVLIASLGLRTSGRGLAEVGEV